MYLCKDCGNKTDFNARGYTSGSCYYKEDALFNIDEFGCINETVDVYDTEYDNYEESDSDFDNVSCNECESDNILSCDEETWEKWIEGEPEENQIGFDSELEGFNVRNSNNNSISQLKEKYFGKEKSKAICEDCGKEYNRRHYICKNCGSKLRRE